MWTCLMISSCMSDFPRPNAANIARLPPLSAHLTMSRWKGNSTSLTSPHSNPLSGDTAIFVSRNSW